MIDTNARPGHANLVKCLTKGLSVGSMINAAGGVVRSCDSPTMMCRAEVTGSLVPTVAKQIQSVEPETDEESRHRDGGVGSETMPPSHWPSEFHLDTPAERRRRTCGDDPDAE